MPIGGSSPVYVRHGAITRLVQRNPRLAAATAIAGNLTSFAVGTYFSGVTMMATGQVHHTGYKFLAFSAILTTMIAAATRVRGTRPAVRPDTFSRADIDAAVAAETIRARNGYVEEAEAVRRETAATAAARVGYVEEAHLEAVKERAKIAAEAATRRIETLEKEKTRAEEAVDKARKETARTMFGKEAFERAIDEEGDRVRAEMTAKQQPKEPPKLPDALEISNRLKNVQPAEIPAIKTDIVNWIRAKYPSNPHMEQAAHDIESLANDRPDLKDEIQLILHQSLVEARLFEDAEKF